MSSNLGKSHYFTSAKKPIGAKVIKSFCSSEFVSTGSDEELWVSELIKLTAVFAEASDSVLFYA